MKTTMEAHTPKQTMIRSSYLACLILSTVLFLPSCKKNGPSPTPTTSSFKNIQVNGVCAVTLTPGASNKINSSGPSILTFMWGNTLMVNGSGAINISVNTLDTLTSLGTSSITNASALTLKKSVIQCAGSSDSINLVLNMSDSVTISTGGDGKYYFSGNTPKLIASESGSGKLLGYNLISQNCNVTVLGSGDAQVYVTGTLSAVVIGSGNVYYKGSPATVTPFTMGTGKVIPQ